jgi:YHYH protein
MNTINNLTSSLTSNQLPSFIANEYPLFVDFIQTYYQGLERSGESLDLVNNLLNYLDVDFYQNEIVTNCILQSNIALDDNTITVDSTDGFPDVDGMIQIDSEIILYKTKTNTQFLNCSRGVSGVTNINGGFTYSYSSPSTHTTGVSVTNLSYLFILYFFSKIKNEYLPYFNQNFTSGLNVSTFIKNIKQFYNVKGTSKSFDFLIRAFFNESNETLYPRERLIKPSDAVFDKKTIIKCKAISGNPLNLVGQKLIQDQPNGYSAFVYIDSVQERFTSTDPIYELVIDNSVLPNNIIVPPKTKLVNPVFSSDTTITVDSTVGFWKSGYIKIGNELIQYSDKTLNQFLNCTRGTNAGSYDISTVVTDTTSSYGLSNIDESKIYLNILGISNSAILTDFSQNYFENDIVYANKVGYSDDSVLTKRWIFNAPKLLEITSITTDGYDVVVTTKYDHGLHVNNPITVYGIDNPIFDGYHLVTSVSSKNQFRYTLSTLPLSAPTGSGYIEKHYKFGNNNIPADVINVYDQNNTSLYVASAGVPSHSIGAGISLGNQRYLKRIPRTPLTTGTATTISPGDVGIFINGVLAQSCISNQSVIFGEVTSISIDNSGSDYGVGISGGPSITISNGTGTTATANCVVNGGLKKVYVVNGGSGYYTKPVVQIVGAGGSGAFAEAIVNNGKVTSILVHNSGTGYTSLPSINLIGGGGNGAILTPIVSGPISQVNITNSGSGYTSNPNITINLGNGAVAVPVISNGIIQSVALISGGSGYNSSPNVFVNDSKGTGTGAQILANITNGSITSFTVISGGINYNDGYTTISIVPSGKNAILTPKVRTWTYNLFAITQLDSNNGYSSLGKNSSFGNQYTYLATPKGLRYQESDNLNSDLTEFTNPITHSPLIGWAYDGNPIYGPYGYTNPLDISSGISRITSKYTLNVTRTNGPNTSQYPLGTFVEDYSLNSGMLDEYNGRYCLTPEFPNGTYAYFTTINFNGTPAFPYILGKKYNSVPDFWNFETTSIQDNLPNDALRYRDPYQNLDVDYSRRVINSSLFNFLQEDGISYILQEDNISYIQSEPSLQLYDYFPRITNPPKLSVKSTEQGSLASIDGFYIESSGSEYKVGDTLLFDNSNTGGYGASAKVSYITGSGVTTVSSKSFTKINYSNLNGGFVVPTNIFGLSSGAGATVSYVDLVNSNLYVTSSGNFIPGELISTNYNSVVSTGITTGTGTSIGSGYTSKTLNTSIGIIDTNITLSSGTGISVGNNLLIGNEILKVFSGSGNTFGVYRGQFGTGSTTYGSGATVLLLPSIQVNNSSLFEIGNYVKIDNEVFRVIDLNNSTNNLTLLRSQVGSGLSSHLSGSTLSKVNVSNATVNKISTTYTVTLGTGTSSYLNQFDTIKVSSGSTFDTSYVGTFTVLSANNSNVTYETKSLGTGNSGTLSYTTNSKTSSGPISEIQLNSGGAFYKILPKVSVSSLNGINASIIPLSSNSGKIKEIQVDDFGYDLNSDTTLKPELSFTKILKLNKTLVVDSINVVNGGSGYQYIPNVSITGGDGQGATAKASINNGKVVSVTITNPGYGYSSAPTITANKTFPCYINTFNSTLNFSVNVGSSFTTGDIVKIYTDGNYPIIFGGLSTSSNISFYAIVGGSLDSNQLQLALNYSDALAGNYIQFVTTGTGNLSLVSQSGSAILNSVLKTRDFIVGETVYQYDNSGHIMASGIVSANYGWQSSTKTLRLDNVSGTFTLNSLRVIGSKSNSTGYPYQIKTAFGRLNVAAYANTNGEFVTETGNISNAEQHIIDSDYYQDYSYVLKNNIDYKNWASSLKNIAHPSGFKVYGNKTISSGSSHISSGQTSSYVMIQQNLSADLSLSTFNDFAISQPDYSTSLKDQVTIYNRLLTSSEQIKTSKVDRIDDISNLFDGIKKNFPIYFNGQTKTYNNNQILLSLNGVIQTSESYDISQRSLIRFNEIPSTNSTINILRVGAGASFASQIVSTGASSYTISSGASNNTSFVSIDGVIQNSDAYTISGTNITFTENVSTGSTIYIRSYGSGISSRQLIGVGSTTNIVPISVNISSGSTNAIVSIDGIAQDPTSYAIGTGSTCIIFSEQISTGSSIYILNFNQKVDYYNSYNADGVSTDYLVDTKIANDDDYIITINGVVQIPGVNNSFIGTQQLVKNINFTEPPKPETKFFGLLYNRINSSENAVIDDFSKSYFTYNTINGNLVVSDYLQQESNGALCNVLTVDSTNKVIAVNNISGTFSAGQTIISGLASSVSTGTTTIVATGSGITSGTNTFSVGSTSGFAVNDYLLVDGEVMKISSISSGTTSFTVNRGLVATTNSYHPPKSLVTKITPVKFTISSVYTGFNGTGTTFTLTTSGNPYNYNGTPFALPSSQLDAYGQDYSQSLLAILNGIIQDNNASGAFTLSGSTINFTEAPKDGAGFYGRYVGKLRRLNDISSKFNGTKLSFNLNIGNNLIYSIIPPEPTVDISNNVLVFINGVLQNPGEAFSIVGSRIIFSEPPRPGTSFLGYVYIGSDNDVIASNILAPIEAGDQIFIDGEEYNRNVLSVDSSSSVSTLGYNGSISGIGAVATASVSSGKISSITVNNGGSGYYQPPVVLFVGGGGYGAQACATVNNGVVTEITITNTGSNYTSAPNIIFARNLTLTKTQRVRAEYSSTYKKVTTLGTGLTFGSGTSLPATNQTVGLGSTFGFNLSGSILVVDNSRAYPVSELITYTNISGSNLTGCVRGVGFNFNKILQLDNFTYNFGLGQTITNGTGATGNVINWDSTNSLLFVNRTSTADFSNGDTIVGVGAGISNAAFIQTYLSYGSGTTVIQVS